MPARRVALLENARRKYGFRISTNDNRWVSALFPPPLPAFIVTAGQCSCDFMPASADADPETRRRVAEQRYRRLGWSTSKIERAISTKSAAATRARPRPQVQRFRSMIADLAELCGSLFLLVHQYHGSTSSEDVAVTETRKVSLAEYRQDSWHYPEDLVIHLGEPQLNAVFDRHARADPGPGLAGPD